MRQFSPTFRAILLVFGIAIIIHANDKQSPEGRWDESRHTSHQGGFARAG